MRTLIGMLPLFIPALIIALGISAVAAPWVARHLRTRRSVAFLLLASLGAIFAATIPPDGTFTDPAVAIGCDLSRIGPASLRDYLRLSETSLNVVLFIPLGFSLTLLPAGRARTALTVLAVSLTFLIEATQLLVPVLDRGCQTADLFDNLLGLSIGCAGGLVIRAGRQLIPAATRL